MFGKRSQKSSQAPIYTEFMAEDLSDVVSTGLLEFFEFDAIWERNTRVQQS